MLSVACSILTSTLVCALSALFAWWLYRGQRTASALNELMDAPAIRKMLIDEPGHGDAMQDPNHREEYERTVLAPTADSIERFAAMANPLLRFQPPFQCQPAFYSRQLIRRVACQTLISIWYDPNMQNYIEASSKESLSPGTTYQEFAALVKWLRENRL